MCACVLLKYMYVCIYVICANAEKSIAVGQLSVTFQEAIVDLSRLSESDISLGLCRRIGALMLDGPLILHR